ncbi:hypothetical protein Barb4_04851 [Bacteroidales bacterium Barb4]|nr:hypothetical protein Barb4_04851 [Bacteroidales bacterium Barb4]
MPDGSVTEVITSLGLYSVVFHVAATFTVVLRPSYSVSVMLPSGVMPLTGRSYLSKINESKRRGLPPSALTGLDCA